MIELIHLHIHKTGGRSFYQTLKSVYGNVVSKPHNRGELFREDPGSISLLIFVRTAIRGKKTTRFVKQK